MNFWRKIWASNKFRAFFLLSLAALFSTALISYSPVDASFDLTNGRNVYNNLLGKVGAYTADLFYQLIGLAAYILPVCLISWSYVIYKRGWLSLVFLRLLLMLAAILSSATILNSFQIQTLPINLPTRGGGAAGMLIYSYLNKFNITATESIIIALVFFCLALGIRFSVYKAIFLLFFRFLYLLTFRFIISDSKDNYKTKRSLIETSAVNKPAINNLNTSKKLNIFTKIKELLTIINIFSNKTRLQTKKQEPQIFTARKIYNNEFGNNNDLKNNNDSDNESFTAIESVEKDNIFNTVFNTTYNDIAGKDKTTLKATGNINSSEFPESNDSDVIPPLDLLRDEDTKKVRPQSLAECEEQAKDLLSVLEDFGIKGKILNISQGPVVTMYEFEPAAGTKSARVIGLSDDIARSLSALSTRIAIIPGRNALGIELPNKQRIFFCLKELINTREFQDPELGIPLILGKDLVGKPLIADLAKMPHLLVAGTTGSGKSVAINTMIMSILYRYTKDQCKMIMIDPKMLELSAYDNIPHLLTPVVTESGKAVVALKWAVKEMENRYKLMSHLNVRNIASYNAKIVDNLNQGKILERRVHTGFDPETGKPTYETMAIEMKKMPFIIIIVDEMADLMLVAGKDIESLIQRLAQMARAAGIHIIMATQRPSVDVITGVIKANFPSRVSFRVISRIDSRTILGEQGAEQLLGMGDMLYMGNSSKIIRVHGPFVDDNEVEKVTNFLRNSSYPEYISAVTESIDEDNYENNEIISEDDSLYKQAVNIVKTEKKTSISYIQRSLRIGYNRAANIIDLMEKNGILSPPNSTGKREILI